MKSVMKTYGAYIVSPMPTMQNRYVEVSSSRGSRKFRNPKSRAAASRHKPRSSESANMLTKRRPFVNALNEASTGKGVAPSAPREATMDEAQQGVLRDLAAGLGSGEAIPR